MAKPKAKSQQVNGTESLPNSHNREPFYHIRNKIHSDSNFRCSWITLVAHRGRRALSPKALFLSSLRIAVLGVRTARI